MPIENFNLEEKTSESEKKLKKEELLRKLHQSFGKYITINQWKKLKK